MTQTEERTVPYEIYERLEAENAQLRAENEQYWREQQWIEELLHVDHSVLSASHKVTLIALYRDLPNHGTDPQGWRQIKTYKLVGDTGSSQDTVLSTIERAKRLGLVEKRKRRVDQGDGNYTTDFFLKDLPALYTPARYQETVQDELLRKHGGKQKPRCINCGSENLDRHEWQHCRSCGYDHFVPLFDDPPQNRQIADTVDADPEEQSADFNVGELPISPTPPQYPQVANIEETHLIVDTLPDPPSELKALPIWCCHRNKKPYDVTRSVRDFPLAESDNPATWTTYEAAKEWLERSRRESWKHPFDGLMFANNGQFVFTDGDHCIDSGLGLEILAIPTYAEVSYGGDGIHSIALASVPEGRKNQAIGLEMYPEKRFFTYTGKHIAAMPATIEPCQEAIDALYSKYFPAREKVLSFVVPARQTTCARPREEILARARKARNGEKFIRLYDHGDWNGYPSQSEADQALCEHLAYWTDGNVSTINELFRQSGLMRPKWNRDDYRTDTIEKAIAHWQRSQQRERVLA